MKNLIPSGALTIYILFTLNCQQGYIVDDEAEEVKWKSWDEGHGTIEFKVEDCDYVSFQELKTLEYKSKYFSLAVDKDSVFYKGKEISEADPQSFRRISRYFFSDHDTVYFFDDVMFYKLDGIGSADFRVFEDVWGMDSKYVCLCNNVFAPRDISSFELLRDSVWAKDRFTYYFGAKELVDVDIKNFSIHEHRSRYFAYDDDGFYWQGHLVEGVFPSDVQVINAYRINHKGKELELYLIGSSSGEENLHVKQMEEFR
jgi:hypothetical protein